MIGMIFDYTLRNTSGYTQDLSKLIYMFHHPFLANFLLNRLCTILFDGPLDSRFISSYDQLSRHFCDSIWSFICKKNFFYIFFFFFSSDRSFHYRRKAYDRKKGDMSKKLCFNVKRNMCLKERIIRKFKRH